jgi:phage-related protein
MAAEVAAVTAKLDSDTKEFEQGFDRAGAKVGGLESQVEAVEDAVAQLGEGGVAAMSELAEHVGELGKHAGEAGEDLGELNEKMGSEVSRRSIMEAIRLVKELGEKALEAAKELDPKEGAKFEKALSDARDAALSVAAALGEVVLPALEVILETVKGVLDLFNGLDDGTKKIIMSVVALAAGFAALAAGVAYVGETAELLAPIFVEVLPEILALVPPVLAIGAAVVVAAIAVEELKKLWNSLSSTVKDEAGGAVAKFVELNKQGFSELWDIIKSIGDGLVKVGNLIGQAMFTPLTMAMRAAAGVADAMKKMGVGDGGDSIRQMADGLDEAAKHMGDDFMSSVKDLPKTLGLVGQRVAEDLKDAVKDSGIEDLWKKFTGAKDHHFESKDDKKDEAKDWAELEKAGKEFHKAGLDAIKEMQKEDAEHQKLVLEELSLREQSALKSAAVARTGAVDAEKAAEEQAKRAQKELDDARKNGSASDIQRAQAAVDAAYGRVQAAAEQVVSADASGISVIDKQIADLQQAAAGFDETSETYRKTHAEISKLESERQAKEEQLHKDAVDLEAKKRDNIERQEKANREFADTLKNLGKGVVDKTAAGGLYDSFSKATVASGGNPIAGAAAVGADLLTQSKGFQDFNKALSGLLQKLADAIGQLLGPLVPVVQAIGDALKPLLDALGAVFGAAGKALVAALTPLMPIITVLAQLLADILQPIAEVMDAIRPLIPIIVMVQEVILAISLIGFAPLLVALKLLGPALNVVAKAIQFVVDGIATVWNAIIDAIASVLDTLAHALPAGAGDAMRDLYNSVEGMKVQTSAEAAASQNLTDTLATLDKAYQDGTSAQVVLTAAQQQAVDEHIAQLHAEAAALKALGIQQAADQANAEANRIQKEVDATAKLGSAADLAARALNSLMKSGMDLVSANDQLHQHGGDSSAATYIAQAIVDAANAGGLNTEQFDAAMAQMGHDLDQYTSAIRQATDEYNSAQSNASNAAAKVQLDKDTITAIQTALSETTDPAVVAELQKQLASAKAQEKLDADANAVAQDQAQIAADHLKVAQQQLEQTILLGELQEAYAENNQQAINQIGDALWGGSLTNPSADSAVGQVNASIAQISTDAAQLAKDQATLQLDTAKATVANSAATNANTQATQALTAATLTNVPAMFKAAQVVDQVLSGQWNGGNTGAQLGGKLNASSTAQAALDSRIANLLATGGNHGLVFNGAVTVNITADDSDVFDAIKKKLTVEKFSRTGTKPRDLVSRHLLAGQG